MGQPTFVYDPTKPSYLQYLPSQANYNKAMQEIKLVAAAEDTSSTSNGSANPNSTSSDNSVSALADDKADISNLVDVSASKMLVDSGHVPTDTEEDLQNKLLTINN